MKETWAATSIKEELVGRSSWTIYSTETTVEKATTTDTHSVRGADRYLQGWSAVQSGVRHFNIFTFGLSQIIQFSN